MLAGLGVVSLATTSPIRFIVLRLTWGSYRLAKHPAVLARLNAEIAAIVGNEEGISQDDIKRMPYLAAVLKESKWSTPLPNACC